MRTGPGEQSAASILTTERLRLDRLVEKDADLMLRVWNDPDFIRFVGDRGIRTRDQAVDALRTGVLRLWRESGYGPYRVSLRDGGESIGVCGLFRREILDSPDIGFGLLPAARGRGYAFEAASVVLAHLRKDLEFGRVLAIVSPGNAASVRIIEKLGMRREGHLRMPGEEKALLLYSSE